MIICVSNTLLCVVLSFPYHLPPHLCDGHRLLAHSSCRRSRCRSPTPPIVTSCSTPRQYASSVVSLLRQLPTFCMVAPGYNNRLLLHTSSNQPAKSSISATEEEVQLTRRSTKRRKRRQRHRIYLETIHVSTWTRYCSEANLA